MIPAIELLMWEGVLADAIDLEDAATARRARREIRRLRALCEGGR